MGLRQRSHRPVPRPAPDLTVARSPRGAASTSLGPVQPRTPRRRWLTLVFILTKMLVDAGMLAAAFVVAYILRRNVEITGPFVEPSTFEYRNMLAVLVACTIVVFNLSGLYRLKKGISRIDEFYKICSAVSFGIIVTIALLSLTLADQFTIPSRQILITGWVLSIAFIALGRMMHSGAVGLLRRHGGDELA